MVQRQWVALLMLLLRPHLQKVAPATAVVPGAKRLDVLRQINLSLVSIENIGAHSDPSGALHDYAGTKGYNYYSTRNKGLLGLL